MITEQERIIRRSQGYDTGFEFNGKKYWINSDTWNKEKEERMFSETGLKPFRETVGAKNLVFYNPEYFEIILPGYLSSYLHYEGSREENIPQPLNMSSCRELFSARTELRYLNLSNWDMSSVKDIGSMFMGCKSLSSLEISTWDTSNVINMRSIFSNCTNLQSIRLSNWDVKNVINIAYMFYNCINLQTIELNKWNISNVTSMEYMFYGCKNLQSLKLANWSASDINPGTCMFVNCEILHSKYGTEDDKELLDRIIEDSNKSTLEQINMF